MSNSEYEYEYHDIAEDADYIDQDDVYYDDGIDEPWLSPWEGEDDDIANWDNYYHNLTEEIDD